MKLSCDDGCYVAMYLMCFLLFSPSSLLKFACSNLEPYLYVPLFPEITCLADELVYGLKPNQNLYNAWLHSTTFIYKFYAHIGLERPRIKIHA